MKLARELDHAAIRLEKQTRRLRKKNKLIVNVQTIIDLNKYFYLRNFLFLIKKFLNLYE